MFPNPGNNIDFEHPTILSESHAVYLLRVSLLSRSALDWWQVSP